jgi:hypothetical protein
MSSTTVLNVSIERLRRIIAMIPTVSWFSRYEDFDEVSLAVYLKAIDVDNSVILYLWALPNSVRITYEAESQRAITGDNPAYMLRREKYQLNNSSDFDAVLPVIKWLSETIEADVNAYISPELVMMYKSERDTNDKH